MIVIITLNPLLEKRFYCNNFSINKTHRVNKLEYTVGGKGINISRQLNLLKVPNQSFTFLGGENGRIIRKHLTHEKINFVAIPTKAQTREATLIIDDNNSTVTTVMEQEYNISKNEIDEMKQKIEKAILNANIVVFAGSLPNQETYEIIEYGTKLAKENDKMVIIDTYGEHLNNCIELAPDIIHNNLDEVNNSLKLHLQNEKQIIDFTKKLYHKGVKITAITDGKNPFIVNNFNFIYKVFPPEVQEIHSTGSGDAFVAGLIYGIYNSEPLVESLKIATTLGAINAQRLDVCNITPKDLENFDANTFKIETIGEKMNTIF